MFRGFQFAIILSLLFSSGLAWAAKKLPHNLSDSDRHTVAEVLGYGSAMKLLSNPYPLGGYYGFEVGVSTEFIPLADIADLGSKDGDKGEFNFYTLSVGKGLFYNIDMFLQFTPMPQSESLSSYAAQFRWAFFEATNFPFVMSVVTSGTGSSFSSTINCTNVSYDLIATVNMKDVALYFGGGRLRNITTFIGGSGLTDDSLNHDVDSTANHAVFGVNIKLDKFFIAMEVDRYTESTYSGKLGARF